MMYHQCILPDIKEGMHDPVCWHMRAGKNLKQYKRLRSNYHRFEGEAIYFDYRKNMKFKPPDLMLTDGLEVEMVVELTEEFP